MAIFGKAPAETDDVITKIIVWFDRHQFRVWYVTCFNAAEDQIGESADFSHKRDAVAYAHIKANEFEAALQINTREGE